VPCLASCETDVSWKVGWDVKLEKILIDTAPLTLHMSAQFRASIDVQLTSNRHSIDRPRPKPVPVVRRWQSPLLAAAADAARTGLSAERKVLGGCRAPALGKCSRPLKELELIGEEACQGWRKPRPGHM
jgi:hypothetical protein